MNAHIQPITHIGVQRRSVLSSMHYTYAFIYNYAVRRGTAVIEACLVVHSPGGAAEDGKMQWRFQTGSKREVMSQPVIHYLIICIRYCLLACLLHWVFLQSYFIAKQTRLLDKNQLLTFVIGLITVISHLCNLYRNLLRMRTQPTCPPVFSMWRPTKKAGRKSTRRRSKFLHKLRKHGRPQAWNKMK